MSFFIYHEHQASSSGLCGVFCLNNLLQRPALTEFDLDKLAKELDDDERNIMASAGETKEYLRFLKTEESFNVGDDGNFSLQVLQAALQKRDLHCIRLNNSNYYGVVCNLSAENAFICNRGQHWFSFRKLLHEEWYNLNSLLDAPQHMPESRLASYLDDLFDKDDVCIYAVRGNLPSVSPANKPTSAAGRWVVAKGSNQEEFDLKVAIHLSKAGSQDVTPMDGEISYPKLPDFKNDEKINYPSLNPIVQEEPLIARRQPTLPPTKDLPIPEHLSLLNEYFGKCLMNMEKMEQRLTAVETAFAKIVKSQV